MRHESLAHTPLELPFLAPTFVGPANLVFEYRKFPDGAVGFEYLSNILFFPRLWDLTHE